MTTDELNAALARIAPSADYAVVNGRIVRWGGPGAEPTTTEIEAVIAILAAERTLREGLKSELQSILTKLIAGTASNRDIQSALANIIRLLP